ncbi:MAG TPA: YggT family protein [Spirochaetia bacterium]|nr:YggT family protein [Spirochaetia bacterium]
MGLFIELVDIVFRVYYILILARVVLSWIRHDPYHPLIRFIYEITEPVLGFFRRIIPSMGMLDLSPLIALLALEFAHWLIVTILLGF